MENYILASVCAIILSTFGCLDCALERAGIRRADLAYAALCVLALSSFRIKPIIEFDIELASLALPVVLALLSIKRESAAARTLARLSIAAMLPIAASAAFTLYEVCMTTYAYFTLRARAVCLAQYALIALDLTVTSFRFAQKKAV